jgi:predicted RNase H-like nuclease (RuvC/YqgF family)
MSDDATQNLLQAKVDQLVIMVKDLISKHAETDARLERIERVLEERLYDTRPIWEAVPAQLQEISERVGRLITEMAQMPVENGNAFRAVDRKIGVLSKTLIDMTADIRELQDKVEKIESQPL